MDGRVWLVAQRMALVAWLRTWSGRLDRVVVLARRDRPAARPPAVAERVIARAVLGRRQAPRR